MKPQYLDYSVNSVLLKNLQLTNKCQRCGCACEDLYCDAHKPIERGSKAPVTGFQMLLKNVTVRGCEVLVNGVVERVGMSAVHAEGIARSLRGLYSKHNAEIRGRMGKR